MLMMVYDFQTERSFTMGKRIAVCFWIIAVLSIAAWGESTEPKTLSIHYKDIPSELSRQSQLQLMRFSQLHKVSAQDQVGVQKIVKVLNMGDDSVRNTHYKIIRQAGEAAIPVIAEMLNSQDDRDRENALTALSLFCKQREYITAKYDDTEQLLILLYRSGLFDRCSDLRIATVCGLAGIGEQRRPKIPEDVKIALQETMINDPDPMVRLAADRCLQDMGVIPRDPNRKDIAN